MEYYYVHKGEKKGPFSLTNLYKEEIQRDTLVWFEGLREWTKASELSELKEIFEVNPPAIPPPPVPNSQLTKKQKFDRIAEKVLPKKDITFNSRFIDKNPNEVMQILASQLLELSENKSAVNGLKLSNTLIQHFNFLDYYHSTKSEKKLDGFKIKVFELIFKLIFDETKIITLKTTLYQKKIKFKLLEIPKKTQSSQNIILNTHLGNQINAAIKSSTFHLIKERDIFLIDIYKNFPDFYNKIYLLSQKKIRTKQLTQIFFTVLLFIILLFLFLH